MYYFNTKSGARRSESLPEIPKCQRSSKSMTLLKLTALDLLRSAYSTLRWKGNAGSSLIISYGSGSESTKSEFKRWWKNHFEMKMRQLRVENDLESLSWNKSVLDARKDKRMAVKSVIIYSGTCRRLALFWKSLYLCILSDCCARLSITYNPTTWYKSVKLKGESRSTTIG